MRILHAPYNIVNIPYLISRGFRELGYTCDVMSFYDDQRGYDSADYTLFKGTVQKPEKQRFIKTKLLSFAAYAITKYDLFQFHQRITMLPHEYDIYPIRWMKKRYYIYHHGSDVIGNNDYLKHVPHAKWAEAIFVSTPDLYDFVPRTAILIPQAININTLARFMVHQKKNRDGINEPVTITHAINSEKAIKHKGSHIIMHAVDELKKRGLKIDFRLLIGKDYNLVLNEIARADIHIDQMHYGWHGTISAEAMGLGTPVVCYIRPDLEEFGEDLPVFRADKINLVERLGNLIQDVDLRKRLSSEGKNYISKVHNYPQVAKKMLEVY